jgi:hypothetical protein
MATKEAKKAREAKKNGGVVKKKRKGRRKKRSKARDAHLAHMFEEGQKRQERLLQAQDDRVRATCTFSPNLHPDVLKRKADAYVYEWGIA